MTNSRSGTQGNDSKKGFASMDEDKQREIASKGGKAAHGHRTDHKSDSEEARDAGSRGGQHNSSSTKNASNSSSRTTSDRDDKDNSGSSRSTHRGGSSEDHSKAGKQSHKNT